MAQAFDPTPPPSAPPDASLSVMAGWLERMGHRAHRSGINWNVGCSDGSLDALEARAERIAAGAGRPLALIGHSRGGHFAKALAHRRPDLVSRVISLGAGLDTAFEVTGSHIGLAFNRKACRVIGDALVP
jgi:triacylglycerol lipase